MGCSPKPTQEQLDELRAEIVELREQVTQIAGALNALVVVWRTYRPPPPGERGN